MKYNNIVIEIKEKMALVTITRPSKLNALNSETIQELHKAFKKLGKDRAIRVIILTGSGEKAFVAGADIAEFAHFSPKEGGKLAQKGQKILFDFIENPRRGPRTRHVMPFSDCQRQCQNGAPRGFTRRHSRGRRHSKTPSAHWQRKGF